MLFYVKPFLTSLLLSWKLDNLILNYWPNIDLTIKLTFREYYFIMKYVFFVIISAMYQTIKILQCLPCLLNRFLLIAFKFTERSNWGSVSINKQQLSIILLPNELFKWTVKWAVQMNVNICFSCFSSSFLIYCLNCCCR